MNSRLLAIKMTGRTATAAIYFGCELHYTEVRQLASGLFQAKDSLLAFLSSLIHHFRIDSAAAVHGEGDTRAKTLTASTLDLLRDKAIPFWAVERSVLFAAYGEVPLKKLHELRRTVKSYWPHILDERDDPSCLDAAALGLYLQTERMLSDNSSPSR